MGHIQPTLLTIETSNEVDCVYSQVCSIVSLVGYNFKG